MLLKVNAILLATDLSENANFAMRHALSMAKAHNAKVHVIHVAEPLSQDASATFRIFMQDETLRTKMMEDRYAYAKETLKKNQKEFVATLSDEEKKAYALVSSVVLIEGHPADMILSQAKKLECNLIVMATHGHSTSYTFLGSVVKRILRRATIPVLVIPADV